MLSWQEIREMRRGGITFGAHTCTHPDLTRLPSPQVEAEVGDSKAIIEDALGDPVVCFAYPYGRSDWRGVMLTPLFPWYVRMRGVPRGLRHALRNAMSLLTSPPVSRRERPPGAEPRS